jgi:pimeloyl-ACP methyl ester carboxylesterase
VLWSVQLVDSEIGGTVANGLLGQKAQQVDLAATTTGLLFAFVTGVAGTFTACNVAVFSAIAPMVDDRVSKRRRLGQPLSIVGWLSLGALLVSGAYGAIGVLLGSRLPQLSTHMVGRNMPERLVQSIVVFTVVGLIMMYLGLAAIRVVPDPLERPAARWAATRPLVIGALIGGFVIGRPWPMFYRMFQHAASTHNPAFGAIAFGLVALGNLLLMGVLLVALSMTRFPRWLSAAPSRASMASAYSLIAGGSFTLIYWAIRVPAHFGYGWFPTMPWK